MTRSSFQVQSSSKNDWRNTKRVCMLLCLLLSTVHGQSQVYKVPQWNRRSSSNGVVHIFFMKHEPFFINDFLFKNPSDKSSLVTSTYIAENSKTPPIDVFNNHNIDQSSNDLLNEHNRISALGRQEIIQSNQQRNSTQAGKAEQTIFIRRNTTNADNRIEKQKRIKRQTFGNHDDKESKNEPTIPTVGLPEKTNDEKIDSYPNSNNRDENHKDSRSYQPETGIGSSKAVTASVSLTNDMSDQDYDTIDDEDQGVFRTLLQNIVINPDEMEPKEMQDVITSSDIVTALVFPIFLVLLIGSTIYVVQKFRSYYYFRWQRHRRHNRRRVSVIPLNNIATRNEETAEENETNMSEVTCEVPTNTTEACEPSENKEPVISASVYNLQYIPKSQSFLKILSELENTEPKKESDINLRNQQVPRKYSSNILNELIVGDKNDSTLSESCTISNDSKTPNELNIKQNVLVSPPESHLNIIQSVPDKSNDIVSVLDVRDESRSASFITSNTSNTFIRVDTKTTQEPKTEYIMKPNTSNLSMEEVKASTAELLGNESNIKSVTPEEKK